MPPPPLVPPPACCRPPARPPAAKQIGPLTLLELSKYDGRDPMRPLLLAVRGKVYDVTPGRAFYGPGALLAWPCCPLGEAAPACLPACLNSGRHLLAG